MNVVRGPSHAPPRLSWRPLRKAIPAAFVHEWISYTLYILVALIWLIPDPRIERALSPVVERHAAEASGEG